MKKVFMTSMLILSSSVVFGASQPYRVAADGHIKLVQYDPNNVVLFNGQYGYQTQIVFAPNEVVQNVSLGDSMAWQSVPVGNNLFIKPVAFSKTNMTVLTNAHSYTFQLDSEVQQNKQPTYKLQFIYPQEGFSQQPSTTVFDPEKLNMKYSYTGAKDLVPLSAFDDGTFTYLKFKSEGASLPAVYTVDEKRHESLVNYHMQGNYVVVHTVANALTLRNGEKVTMVYNDLAIGDWRRVKGI